LFGAFGEIFFLGAVDRLAYLRIGIGFAVDLLTGDPLKGIISFRALAALGQLPAHGGDVQV
jgi:hypothetical protein